jgi:adenylosuccinate lyase
MKSEEEHIPFRDVLIADNRVRGAISRERLEHLLDPSTYLGAAPQTVDNVLAAAGASGWLEPEEE